ncbi:MAG: transposase [Pirellulales bacterium]|nr:transposase [Pirellulales bacterium]
MVSCALLVAIGVQPDGRRSVLGLSVSLSEAEVH